MSSDRQHLVGAIRHIAGIGTQDGNAAFQVVRSWSGAWTNRHKEEANIVRPIRRVPV